MLGVSVRAVQFQENIFPTYPQIPHTNTKDYFFNSDGAANDTKSSAVVYKIHIIILKTKFTLDLYFFELKRFFDKILIDMCIG